MSDSTIPVIDLSGLRDGGAGRRAIAAAIGEACRSIGFFTIANHGIEPSLLSAVFRNAAALFALPAAEKAELSIERSRNNRGYVTIGGESLDPSLAPDLKEAFNIGRDDGTSLNLWPAAPEFRAVMEHYFSAVRGLCEELHKTFAIDLGLPEDYFAASIDRPQATLRLLRYPPVANPLPPGQYGAGPHTDYGNITILAQDDVGGLEVRTRAGAWIAAPPIPGAFVCNIGDCLMRWSNDVYVSTPHRVTNSNRRERYSVAFFFDPNEDANVACLPTCQSEERPARYAPISGGDYIRSRLDATYAFRQEEKS